MLLVVEEFLALKYIRLKMKKLFFLLMICLLITSKTQAQIEESSWNGRFGIGVGYSPMWLFTNSGEINKYLNTTSFPQLKDNGIYLNNYSGFVYVMLVNNLRLGGFGYSGKNQESFSTLNIERQSIYNVNAGGITLEYSLPFENFTISTGIMLGVGETTYEFSSSSSNPNWDDVLKGPGGTLIDTPISNTSKISNNYYIFCPTINTDIALTRFLTFRAGVGYQITFDKEWKLNGISKINGVPSELKSDAFFIQAGLFIGLFAF